MIINKVFAPSLLSAKFRNVPTSSQYFCRRLAFFERCARDQLGYLAPYLCVEVYALTTFGRVSRYGLLPSKCASIEVPMRSAPSLSPCISYLCNRLRNVANSGLWVLVFTGWTASCARLLLWDDYEYQRLR